MLSKSTTIVTSVTDVVFFLYIFPSILEQNDSNLNDREGVI
jgi:hypothetical protein